MSLSLPTLSGTRISDFAGEPCYVTQLGISRLQVLWSTNDMLQSMLQEGNETKLKPKRRGCLTSSLPRLIEKACFFLSGGSMRMSSLSAPLKAVSTNFYALQILTHYLGPHLWWWCMVSTIYKFRLGLAS